MDKNERVKKVADVEVKREGGLAAATSEAISENEDTFPAESSSEAKRQPGNSLLGRRNTGNNLYIKIPSNATESGDSSAEEEDGTSGSNLRRNSISMPVLNTMDLDALRLLHEKAVQDKMNSIDSSSSVASSQKSICTPPDNRLKDTKGKGGGRCSSSSSSNSSSDEDDKPAKQMLFRTKRRSSIAPLPALRLNDKDIMANEMDTHSIITQNSISSINSLASLLKEKFLKVPSYIRRKREKSHEFKVKAFVAFLFLLIVFLISYAYIMYDYKVLSKMYFERIKFSQKTRSLKLFSEDRTEILLQGRLGLGSNLGPKPIHCKTNDLNELCFEWGRKMKLFMSETELDRSISCYNVQWEPLNDNVRALDCYEMEEGVHWYGGGLTRELAWPLEEGRDGVPLSPFVTGDGQEDYSAWGNVQRRYFINSNGIAIEIDEESPLYVSINANRSQEFCIKSRYDDYAFVNRVTKYPVLAYRVCTGANMLTLHRRLTQKGLWDGLRENEVNLLHLLIEEPVWQVTDPTGSAAGGGGSSAITPTTVEQYTDGIIAMGFAPLGHVLFDERWQKNAGDFAVDEDRFDQFGEMVQTLQRRGFKVALTVQPLISTKSPLFAEAVEKQLLITERKSEGTVPALTRFKASHSAGVLDITREETIAWWVGKLTRLVEEYKVNGFYLELGSASTIPRYYQTSIPLLHPDDYKRVLMQKLEGVLNIIGVSAAVQVPKPPTFVSLLDTDSSWKGLRRTLISALSSSVLGYPFLMSNTIGGDLPTNSRGIPGASVFLNETVAAQLPEEELFIRWFQLAAFLPGMRFSCLPAQFHSDQVMEVAKELFAIRSKFTIPLYRKYLSDAINDASQTLIRPLWMLDPEDATCYYVQDEFAVGPEIIVAPVLEQGQRQREVYLPFGVWKDGIDGSLRKGSRWIHNYQVPLDKVAYFIKMPDNTRF